MFEHQVLQLLNGDMVYMGSKSCHITLLVLNSLGGRHTHMHTNTHTHTDFLNNSLFSIITYNDALFLIKYIYTNVALQNFLSMYTVEVVW